MHAGRSVSLTTAVPELRKADRAHLNEHQVPDLQHIGVVHVD